MFLAGRAAWAAIVFIFLTTGISGPRAKPLASGASSSRKMPAVGHQNEIKNLQETLRNKGHYRGKVDGVFGLRTRASIRAYQKAENFPISGEVDAWTADGLGIRPESIWDNSGVPGGTLDAVPTGPAVTLTEVNLQQALGELKVKPGRLSGRKSHGLFLPNTTAERTLANNKLRTKNTNSSPAFLVAFRRIYGQQTYSQFNFKGSSEEDRQAENSREYRNKETVFSQGDASDAMFYIQDGNVKLTVTSRRGKIAALAILRQGDFFGERCLVSRSLRTFTATAIQQSTVARVKRSTMVRIIQQEPGFAKLVIAYLLSPHSPNRGRLG